ncbi:DUF2383 domain-containing protein [Luteolibacter sp. AS25]|uniref:DUF2383 domain-containing protein n=1 Tax=Luteolibacter sp. AS25 TaxID=3135776 RepID=UPI00398ACFBC
MSASLINDDCIKTCNKLLRGELSAVETYERAIEKHPESPATSELRRIQNEHRESVSILTKNVVEMGGEPETDSGAWGTFANAIQCAANLFGKESAIESLQNGEEHGQKDYQEALESDDVMDHCKTLIQTALLPKVESHIKTLERLEDQVA